MTLERRKQPGEAWETVSSEDGGIPFGEGSPIGTVDPPQSGRGLYFDTSAGALYVSSGTANTDWFAVGGNFQSNTVGVAPFVANDGRVSIYLMATDEQSEVSLTDKQSYEEGSYGIRWSNAKPSILWADNDGNRAEIFFLDRDVSFPGSVSVARGGFLGCQPATDGTPGIQIGWDGTDRAGINMGGNYLIGLPTSDPHVAGALWNDNWTPKISSG